MSPVWIAGIAILLVIGLIVFLRRKKKPEVELPPVPTYGGVQVSEARNVGHGVYELWFAACAEGNSSRGFPESLAYFIEHHPELRIVAVAPGTDHDGRGAIRS